MGTLRAFSVSLSVRISNSLKKVHFKIILKFTVGVETRYRCDIYPKCLPCELDRTFEKWNFWVILLAILARVRKIEYLDYSNFSILGLSQVEAEFF